MLTIMLKENELEHENQASKPSRDTGQPGGYRVNDDHNLEEKDLKRSYLFGSAKMKSPNEPGMEGNGMGGHAFGQNNSTPAGNDEANPPENAGEDNAYFARTQPAEEHPEDENFVVKDQEGSPGNKAGQPNIPGPQEDPEQQEVGENDDKTKGKPNPQEEYREGTVDKDGKKEWYD
jgi:hypothetical protein